MSARRLPTTLLVLSPGTLVVHDTLALERFEHTLARLAALGLESFLLREPLLTDAAFLKLARRVRAHLGASAFLALHDRPHLIRACGADALHVGWRSLAPRDARAALDDETTLGFSAHAGDDPLVHAPCDYLLLGPVFDTQSKRGHKEPLGLAAFARACENSTHPIVGVGGITVEHACSVLRAGAHGVAVRGGVFDQAEPARAFAAYQRALRACGATR